MEFLYLLESVRIPVLNEFMLGVTRLGEETAFLVVALIIFWCIDKYKGYYILSVGFIGTLANQFLKLWYRIPRPWVIDKDFTILEAAREAAAGYSFPSGHTQSAVGTFGAIAYTTKNRNIKVLSALIAVLVAFSRMYIGVHTPLDVFVSVAIAMILIVAMKSPVLDHFNSCFPYVFIVMLLMSLGFLGFVELYNFPVDIDAHNLASGSENAYTLFGCLLGLLVVYIIDERWLNFSTKAVWWAQIGKVVGGLALVLVVKAGLKAPMNALFGDFLGRSIRYMLIVIVAGALWPLSFKYFKKFGAKDL